jgi:hypothetical protein
MTARRALNASPPASTPTARPPSTAMRSTRRPVTIVPPAWRRAAAKAALTAPLPPSAAGMPWRSPSRCMMSA